MKPRSRARAARRRVGIAVASLTAVGVWLGPSIAAPVSAQTSEPARPPSEAEDAAPPPADAASGDAAAPAGGPRRLDAISIIGNRELPTALYIVPWKRSDPGDLLAKPENSLLDEVFAPVDPDVFSRRLDYYETFHVPSP